LEELRVEIDQQKREREVAKITQSDYFKELQAEAESLQADAFWSPCWLLAGYYLCNFTQSVDFRIAILKTSSTGAIICPFALTDC